jgi:cytidine deaminase
MCERDELIESARRVAVMAHAPYSHFRVGAALRARSGALYLGSNVEISSYGLSMCAERVALAAAISSGEQDLVELAIACIDAPSKSELNERVPCGACRQWIQDLAPNIKIYIDGTAQSFVIGDLLPYPFQLNPAVERKLLVR